MRYQMLPDWGRPKSLSLVYPKNLHTKNTRTPREILLPMFHQFLSTLNLYEPGLRVNILVQEKEATLDPSNYPKLDIIQLPIKCQDIWIKDWAPIPVLDTLTKENTFIKTIYHPDYCPYKQKSDDLAGCTLQTYLKNVKNDHLFLSLKWDIGNLTTNGKVLISTTKLATLNDLSQKSLEAILKLSFNIKKVVLIPVEKHDYVGHIDGVVRFISEDTVIIPQYTAEYEEEFKYMTEVKSILKKELPYIKIFEIPCDLVDQINPEGIYTAEGNYINYLRLGKNVYIPQYNNYEDGEALRAFKRAFRNYSVNFIPVSGEVNKLAYLGGVLNCFSYVEF